MPGPPDPSSETATACHVDTALTFVCGTCG